MSRMRLVLIWMSLAAFAFVLPYAAYAQTPTSGSVAGTVIDAQGGAIPGASIALESKALGLTQTVVSDAMGRYLFATVSPGDYTLAVTAKSFKKGVVGDVHVEVNKALTINVTLELGAETTTVEIVAGTGADLDVTTTTVGTTLGGVAMERLPVYTRSASALMFLQPAVTPNVVMLNPATGFSANVSADIVGGQVAGSRSEQIVFNLDGGDATSDMEGSNNYISPPGEPQPAPIIPVPQGTTQEFRVATSNPTAEYGRSSGGQVSLVTKQGTNNWHGAAYEYHTDDAFDGNRWENDLNGINKAHAVDNRFGANVGGPIWKDKLWFFGGYEGRRFAESSTFFRAIPTTTLREGIIQFADSTGTVRQYNLNTANGALAANCGTTQDQACDPLGIGASPVSLAQFALYNSLPNTNGVGGNATGHGTDGLNETVFSFNAPTPIKEDIGVLRLDWQINNNWSMFASYHTAVASYFTPSNPQVDLLNSTLISETPYYPNFYTLQVTGQLGPHWNTQTHGSFTRNWWEWNRDAPAPLVAGTTQALEFAGEGTGASTGSGKTFADPININTQNARSRIWNGHDFYLGEDVSWVHGAHTVQFGGSGYNWNDYHQRTDDVLGGLSTAPTLFVEAIAPSNTNATNLEIPTDNRPATCGGAITTNCISGSLTNRWNELYASTLGLVDRAAQLESRNGQFQPSPLGTPLADQVNAKSFYGYVQDTWQLRRGLNFTAGVNWGTQLAPTEQNGKQVVFTDPVTNAPINFQQFLASRASALGSGICFASTAPAGTCPVDTNILNPQFALTPVGNLSGPLTQFKRDNFNEFGPRFAIAWNVPWNNWLFGNHQTVIRGGYALLWDRTSAVGEVLNPLITGGLADLDVCSGPLTTGACSNAPTDPTSAFRIGVNGNSVGLPPVTAVPIPYNPTSLFLSAPLDPYVKPGHIHNIDFTIQRALPGRMLLEVGYIGRFSRNLAQATDLTAPYYKTKDKVSGETLAQAVDALQANEFYGTALPDQPFFENLIGTANCMAMAGTSCTQLVLNNDNNQCGCAVVNDLMDFSRIVLNPLLPSNIDNQQVYEFSGVTDKGYSDYNAGFISVSKALSNGLQFQFNWTYSHAIGNGGTNQQYIYSADSPYNLNIDRSSEAFDRQHVINLWWYYELPFGTGKPYKTGNDIMNRVIGGWHVSGIFTFATGIPQSIGCDGNYGSFLAEIPCLSPMDLHGLEGYHTTGTTGGNVFANPTAVYNSLVVPGLSTISQLPFDEMRSFRSTNVDFSVGKNLAVTERVKVLLTADFLNLFNHPLFNQGTGGVSFDLANGPSALGVITSQDNSPRVILLSLRVEF